MENNENNLPAELEKPSDWQPLIEAIAPHAPEMIRAWIDGSKAQTVGMMSLEKMIIWLGFSIVAVVGLCSAIAVFKGNYDTAERLCIPLISFAGGLGIGARLSRGNTGNKV